MVQEKNKLQGQGYKVDPKKNGVAFISSQQKKGKKKPFFFMEDWKVFAT